MSAGDAFFRARDIRKSFRRRSGLWRREDAAHPALAGVSCDLAAAEILGVVGESGSGKSTLARIIVGVEAPDHGTIELAGRVLTGPPLKRPVDPSRRGIQMVFQDPRGSLDPRLRIQDIVGEGLEIARRGTAAERRERVAAALSLVGLRPQDGERYPHQFSGGQRQRIAIARSLVLEPRMLIADEAVSALDLSVQMQILNLLLDLRDRFGLAILFITHDIGVVAYLCDRVIVLARGAVVEEGGTAQILNAPQHPYTQRLIAAVPRL